MNRFSGWTRGSAVAALMVLSTGACAQRVPLPPEQVYTPPPVARQAAPIRPTAPVPAPAAPLAVPDRQVAAAPPAPPPPRQATRPAPQPQEVRQSAAPPAAPPAETAARPAPAEQAQEPVAPRVASTAPPSFGGQFRAKEVASADYGSTQGSNPTPDAAPDRAALSDSDTPPAKPAPRAAVAPPAPEPVAAPDASDNTLVAALSTLFGSDEPDEDEPEETPDTAQQSSPSDGFDDDAAFETAQIYQQPIYDPAAPVYAPAPYEPAPYEPEPVPGYAPAPAPYDPAPAPEPTYAPAPAIEPAYAQQPAYVPAPPPVARFDPGAPITVAILTPDTDSRASIRTLAKGLSQAAALSARTQGNRQMVLRGYDTGGTPEKARRAAQQAISDGAQLIVGPLFSTSASAVAPVAQGAGVPVIAFTTDTAVLGNGLYSVGFLPDAEVERMLSFAAQRGVRKIGLLSPDTPYGGIVFRTVQNAAPGYGVDVATVQPIGSDFSQAAATGERFASFYKSAPDTNGVLIATNGKPLQGIAAYLAYNDVLPSKVQYMGLGTWDDPETFREATLVGGWFPGIDPALKAEFEGRYSGAYGGTPPAIATLAYDGIAMAGALIERAQASGQTPFTRQNIENPTGFRGMSGLFRFLPDGRNQRLLSILKVGRRQFEMLDPAPTAFSQRLTSITGYSQ